MLGHDTGNLLQDILNHNVFGADDHARAHEEDRKPLAPEWVVEDTKLAATKIMTEFLAFLF
jgi:hypothetical protein